MLVNTEHIVTSDKFKYSDDGFKFFTGYQEDEIVKPLWIILTVLETVAKTCIFWLKITMYWINTIKFGMWLKIN